jgi:outer membrane protein W
MRVRQIKWTGDSNHVATPYSGLGIHNSFFKKEKLVYNLPRHSPTFL